MFGFSPAQVQKWEKGGGMPASALYIIRSTGQSIDAFIDQGQPTLTAELPHSWMHGNRSLKRGAGKIINLKHARKRNAAASRGIYALGGN
jgi:hypothetical protein